MSLEDEQQNREIGESEDETGDKIELLEVVFLEDEVDSEDAEEVSNGHGQRDPAHGRKIEFELNGIIEIESGKQRGSERQKENEEEKLEDLRLLDRTDHLFHFLELLLPSLYSLLEFL